MSDLQSLLERIKAASGWDSQLDKDILRYLGFTWRGMAYWNNDNQMWKEPVDFTASTDAALALVERMLPGRSVIMGVRQTETTRPWARVGAWSMPDATAANLPLAILAALLTALIAQAKGGDHGG